VAGNAALEVCSIVTHTACTFKADIWEEEERLGISLPERLQVLEVLAECEGNLLGVE
jgi:hypothetical protein